MADEDGARALVRRREERLHELARIAEREGDGRPDVARAAACADPLPCEVAGAVLEIGGEHLVAGAEVE
jgi:hypothetical protein